MDQFSKQKINEQKYKQFRDQPKEEYNGDYKSPHFKEVKNQSVQSTYATSKDEYSTEYKEKFDKASKDFWQKKVPSGLSKYNGGSMTANFGRDKYTVEELLERIGTFVKESISNELIEKKLPTGELTENFKAVDIALKLLGQSISKIDDKMDIKNLAAYLHGFINTYVDNMVRKKLERDKGNVSV